MFSAVAIYIILSFVNSQIKLWPTLKQSEGSKLPPAGLYNHYRLVQLSMVLRFTNGSTHVLTMRIRGGAEKSLDGPTSQCRRTESIVSLEREVCSCPELQVFSCYRGWKEACQATRAISTTWRRELSSSFFFSCETRRRRKFTHSERNVRGICTIACHRQKPDGPV